MLVAPARATPFLAFNGEVVDVTGPRAQEVADLIASFPQGSEIGEVRAEVVAAEAAKTRCRGGIACYFPTTETLVMPDEVDGFAWEQVLAHEYGHHVAANRGNTPWNAVQTGPKRWATVVGVCKKGRGGMLLGYERHPGEAFAESYRLLVASLARTWTPFPIVVDASLYPMGADVQAAVHEDVFRPWTEPRTYTLTRRVAAGATTTFRLQTPLDGDVDAKLLGGRGTLRLGRASGREVYGVACGDRTMKLTLRAAETGIFRISVTVP